MQLNGATRDGYELRVSYVGAAGLEAAREFHPQVVISDIGLPGLDGFELARALRQDPRFAGLILVAVTGYGDRETVERARSDGFDRHFVKPMDLDALIPLLDRASVSPAGVNPRAMSDARA